MLFNTLALLATFVHVGVHAATVSTRRDGDPVVSLNYATFQGFSTSGVDTFLGIPYAQPPVGDLRFRRPKPPLPLPGTTLTKTFGDACSQQSITLPNIPGLDYTALAPFLSKVNASEDCLFANVFRPAGVTNKSKLPVVVWFFGGGFEIGDASPYDGTTVVQRSVELSEPVIYVSFNYRVNAFGFLGGKEVLADGAANLGLYDQRFFLDWVETYISKFGGDPNQITVWGHSAGAISITAHIATNPVHPPFKAAILQSGYTIPIVETDNPINQATYDGLVKLTGCSTSTDTLECLRAVPYTTLRDAVDAIASSISFSLIWDITIDGELIKKPLRQYFNEGSYARVPILGGEVDDEGTLFALSTQSITTDAEVKDLLGRYIFPGATDTQIDSVADNYPQDPAAGSPFGTGNLNVLTPEFKRLAAIEGDLAFQSNRRFVFSEWAATQNVWSYLWKRRKDLLYLGSFHGGDLPEMYGAVGDHLGTDAIVNFINYGDPNYPEGSTAPSLLSSTTWPKYTLESKQMLLFSDDPTEEYTTIPDTYRAAGIDAINVLLTEFGA